MLEDMIREDMVPEDVGELMQVDDAGGGSDGDGNDIDESRTWKLGSILSSRRQLHS